jgi:hypothetical protein
VEKDCSGSSEGPHARDTVAGKSGLVRGGVAENVNGVMALSPNTGAGEVADAETDLAAEPASVLLALPSAAPLPSCHGEKEDIHHCGRESATGTALGFLDGGDRAGVRVCGEKRNQQQRGGGGGGGA